MEQTTLLLDIFKFIQTYFFPHLFVSFLKLLEKLSGRIDSVVDVIYFEHNLPHFLSPKLQLLSGMMTNMKEGLSVSFISK